MGLTRRGMLAGALAVAGVAAPGAARAMAGVESGRFLSGADDREGNSWLVGFDDNGDGRAVVRFRTPLPGRAHHPAPAPGGDFAFAPARRPGDWAAVVDLRDGRLVEMCPAAPGRHFYGHAVFSADGERLFTTENDYDQDRGMVVVRSTRTLRPLGEFPSGGIGPHQLAWFDDRRLAVANGGIRTHPSAPRKKLNLDTMRPNLVLLDAATGREEARAIPPHPQLSVRHLDVARGMVVAGMQYEGPITDDVPLLLAFDGASERLRPLEVPLDVQRKLRQYTASVCADPATGHVAVTCPRGNLVTFWSLDQKRFVASLRLRDTGGVALDDATREFVVTSGGGDVFRLDAATFEWRREATRRVPGLRWDNHVAAV